LPWSRSCARAVPPVSAAMMMSEGNLRPTADRR
jgi:hypothetical protein